MTYDEDEQKLDENGLPVDILNDDQEPDPNEENGEEENLVEKIQDTKDTVDKIKNFSSKSKGGAPGSGGEDPLSSIKNIFGKGGGKSGQLLGKMGGKAGGAAAKMAGGSAAAGGAAGGSALAAAAPVIGWVLLILLIIICLAFLIYSITAFLNSKSDPENMKNNAYVTNEYFYGLRSIYIDEEALINSLQLSYKQYVIDVIENFEETNPTIDITIELPILEDGARLENSTTIDSNITNMSIAIANLVASGSSDYTNADFSTLYANIEYFGLTTDQGNLVTEFIVKYITDNNLYSSEDDTSNINSLLETTIKDDSDLQYIYNLCEKVMIKDEIATETGITGIEQRNYIASIYMPNKTVDVSSCVYTINGGTDDFSVTYKLIEKNGDIETIKNEKELTGDVHFVNGFTLGSVKLEQFQSINTENPNLFNAEISLFEAMRLSFGNQYFTQKTVTTKDGSEAQVYTWMPIDTSLLYLTFDTNSNFIFNEFSFSVKDANSQ